MDRGKYYGDGFFESILIRNGDCPLIKYHFERVTRTLTFLEFNTPEHLSTLELFYDLVMSNYSQGVSRCRLDICRIGEGRYLPVNENTSIELKFEEISDPLESLSNGIEVGVCDFRINTAILNQYKTLAKLPQVLLAKEAYRKGWQEAVVLNEEMKVAELISSNIFFINTKGILFTPHLSSGCLPGVFRQFLLNEFTDRLHIIQCDIYPTQFDDFVAAFATNAVQGIVPIRILNGRQMNVRLIEPIFEEIKKWLTFS